MAFGGGIWQRQDHVLPGTYINFESAQLSASALSDRGIAALALPLDWGESNAIITVTKQDFMDRSLAMLGHDATAPALRDIREALRGAQTLLLYRLNSGGTKASNAFATAHREGTRGNDILIAIDLHPAGTASEPLYDVMTYIDGTRRIDTQTVRQASELVDNALVTFAKDATLLETAGIPLSGGTNGEVNGAAHQAFLDKVQSYAFHALGCIATDEAVKGLYAAFTRRMREETGRYFQCVLHQYAQADYEGIISLENSAILEGQTGINALLVPWVTGAQAGCPVESSVMNNRYDGEYTVDLSYTQAQLESGIRSGRFLFHRVDGHAHVLSDINTLVTYTTKRTKGYSKNQTVRVLDQVANDTVRLFGSKYIGNIPNDPAGRNSLWADIVAILREMETRGAIEDFTPNDDVLVSASPQQAESVVATYAIVTAHAMEKLYASITLHG